MSTNLRRARILLQRLQEIHTPSGLRTLAAVLPEQLPERLSAIVDPLAQQGNYLVLLGGDAAKDGRIMMAIAAALRKKNKTAAQRLLRKLSNRAKRWQLPQGALALITASRKDDRMLTSIAVKDPQVGATYRFKTGVPVEFRYYRNTEKAPYMGNMFDQDVEPAGRYMLVASFGGKPLPGWEMGTQHFRSPLVIEYVNTRGEDGWKQRLSRHYGGKRKRALARAIMHDGHDGIVTVDTAGHDVKEVVALGG